MRLAGYICGSCYPRLIADLNVRAASACTQTAGRSGPRLRVVVMRALDGILSSIAIAWKLNRSQYIVSVQACPPQSSLCSSRCGGPLIGFPICKPMMYRGSSLSLSLGTSLGGYFKQTCRVGLLPDCPYGRLPILGGATRSYLDLYWLVLRPLLSSLELSQSVVTNRGSNPIQSWKDVCAQHPRHLCDLSIARLSRKLDLS